MRTDKHIYIGKDIINIPQRLKKKLRIFGFELSIRVHTYLHMHVKLDLLNPFAEQWIYFRLYVLLVGTCWNDFKVTVKSYRMSKSVT